MPALSANEAMFLGIVLEFFFYGVYCVIYALYLKIQHRSGSSRLRYPLTVLFVLCSCYVWTDFAINFISIFRTQSKRGAIAAYGLAVSNNALFAFIDSISQGVLIYRCWVMWNGNPLFIVVPSILTTTSFVLTITLTIKYLTIGATGILPAWWFKMALGTFSISLCVNAVVTGLLVFKILSIHRSNTRDAPVLQGSYKLRIRPLIAIIVESGMFMLIAQTLWIVFVQLENEGNTGIAAIIGSTTMIYGITPTIVLVRSAMGRAYNLNDRTDTTIEFKFDVEHGGETAAGCSNPGIIGTENSVHKEVEVE